MIHPIIEVVLTLPERGGGAGVVLLLEAAEVENGLVVTLVLPNHSLVHSSSPLVIVLPMLSIWHWFCRVWKKKRKQ
jgi:hypothetical protein